MLIVTKLKLILKENKSFHSSLENNTNRLLGLNETFEDYDEGKVINRYNGIADLNINIESKIIPLCPDDNLDTYNVCCNNTNHNNIIVVLV